MFIKEDSLLHVPHFEPGESEQDIVEMRQQAVAIFYGWGLPVL